MARGEFVALLDHDDELHPDALRLVDEALRAHPDADYAYTDEDKIDEQGRRSAPVLKPDWSPERFRTQMYTCHLSVLRASLVDEVGGFRDGFEGSQDWDLVLRVTERARQVVHVPQVLYHWRTLATSTAGRGEAAKPYAYEAGTRALQAHCDRIGFPAPSPGRRAPRRLPPAPRPATDHPRSRSSSRPGGTGQRGAGRAGEPGGALRRLDRGPVDLPGLRDRGGGRHRHPPGVTDHLGALGGDRLRVVPYDRPFNFSDKINTGALAGRGEHVLLLNDDMEVVTPDWMERLVMYSSFPGIGAVGPSCCTATGGCSTSA